MLSFANRLIAASGMNVTSMLREAPGAGLAVQSCVCANQEAACPSPR